MTLRVAAKDIEYSRTNEIVGPCRAEQRACTGGDDFPDFEGEVVADSGDGPFRSALWATIVRTFCACSPTDRAALRDARTRNGLAP